MKLPEVLVLSYSNLGCDPRVIRQLEWLQGKAHIHCAGFGPPPSDIEVDSFSQIYYEPKPNLARKIRRAILFFFFFFERYFFDEYKQTFLRLFLNLKFYLIIANDPASLYLAHKISSSKDQIVFDAHEYHPSENLESKYWRMFHRPMVNYLIMKYASGIKGVITVNDSIAAMYLKNFNLDAVVISNAGSFRDLKPLACKGNPVKFVHHGAAIKGRRMEDMIEAFLQMRSGDEFHLFLSGTSLMLEYREELKRKYRSAPGVFFHDPVPFKKICETINNYDVGLYFLPVHGENENMALPNKVFEFIQARLAMVVSPNPEMKNLVEKHELGIVADDFIPESYRDALRKLNPEVVNRFKENAHKAAQILNAEANREKFLKICGL